MIDTDPKHIATYPDADSLAEAAAGFVLSAAKEAIQVRGYFSLALAGGSTPEKCYSLLAQADPTSDARFSCWKVFFGDERYVPLDDPRSNYAMARRSLLATGLIPDRQVFPVPVEKATVQEAAIEYCQILAQAFEIPTTGPAPQFDLILLGMGDDGHTASLFPSAKALTVTDDWVTWSPPGMLPPPVDRITFTFPTINAARQVLFLVAGASKTKALEEVLGGHASIVDRPAAGVRPSAGTLTWLLNYDVGNVLEELVSQDGSA